MRSFITSGLSLSCNNVTNCFVSKYVNGSIGLGSGNPKILGTSDQGKIGEILTRINDGSSVLLTVNIDHMSRMEVLMRNKERR